MSKTKWIRTSNGLNVIVDGQNRVIPNDHQKFKEILKALEAGKDILDLLDEVKKKVEDFSGVDFQIVAGELMFRGQPYENKVITKLVFDLLEKGFKAAPLIRFMEKVEANPNPQSVEHLWTWMQNTGLAITDDGDILAFKYVDKVDDLPDGQKKDKLKGVGAVYTDSYKHIFDYTPGREPFIPRHLIKYDPETACGVGLHVGDLSYVKGSQYVLAVSVSPTDVCSVANDDSRKIRVCRLKCLHIVNPEHLDNAGYKEPVYSLTGGVMSPSQYKKNIEDSYSKAVPAPDGYCDHDSGGHWEGDEDDEIYDDYNYEDDEYI